MDVPLVDQQDVLERPVVAREHLDVVLLDPRRLLDDSLVRAGDLLGEEPLPLVVAELDPVQRLELRAQVGDQCGLARDPQVLVGLTLEELDERRFELGLALVRRLPGVVGNELGDDGALVADGDRLVARRRRRLAHAASGKVSSRSR